METSDDTALRRSEATETRTLSTANDEDVIYGRGNHLKNHPGNQHYRILIKALKDYYLQFPKDKKKKIGKLVYDSIKGQCPPGRFLAEIQGRQYVELRFEDALRKISQCLRENKAKAKVASPRHRKKISDHDVYEKLEEMQVRLQEKQNKTVDFKLYLT